MKFLKGLSVMYLFFYASINLAQVNAITELGEEVILYDDGSWEYKNKPSLIETPEILLNPATFEKDEQASFLVKSKLVSSGVYINPKKWKFIKLEDSEDAEYQFELKSGDAYAILITEKIEIALINLKEIAIDNAKSAATGVEVQAEEYRMINGRKMLMLKFKGEIQGMKITYMGYYYSYEGGTIQLLSFTGNNLFDEFEEELESLLNGLVMLD